MKDIPTRPVTASDVNALLMLIRERLAPQLMGHPEGRALALADDLLEGWAASPPKSKDEEIRERRVLVTWLRQNHYAKGSVREAVRRMRSDAARQEFGSKAPPITLPGEVLYHIWVISGGEFPSDRTLRDDLRGFGQK